MRDRSMCCVCHYFHWSEVTASRNLPEFQFLRAQVRGKSKTFDSPREYGSDPPEHLDLCAGQAASQDKRAWVSRRTRCAALLSGPIRARGSRSVRLHMPARSARETPWFRSPAARRRRLRTESINEAQQIFPRMSGAGGESRALNPARSQLVAPFSRHGRQEELCAGP